MEGKELLHTLAVAERLKDTTRHCYTSKGRQESVAEHSWMMTLMAFFMKNEFPDADINKIIQMCIIHDLGECFTGDIPTFRKTKEHEDTEEHLLNAWIDTLPEATKKEMKDLYKEMAEKQTIEAKIYKAIKIIVVLVIGFVVAIILMSVAIYFGDINVYSTSVDTLPVKIFGIPIYELTKSGTKYIGKTIEIYMGVVCGICMFFSAIAEELISRVKHK